MTVPLSTPALCCSLNTSVEQPVVWQTGSMSGEMLQVRPVSLHNDSDLNVIHDWFTGLYHGYIPADQLRLLFELIAESTVMQAFMILQYDDKPIGELEVYDVMKDEMRDAYPAQEGDFRICIPGSFAADTLLQMLEVAIPYFFSFSEVVRMVWAVPVVDVVRNRVAAKPISIKYIPVPPTCIASGSDRAPII